MKRTNETRKSWREAWNEAASWVQNCGALGGLLGGIVSLVHSEKYGWKERIAEALVPVTAWGLAGGVLGLLLGTSLSRQRRRPRLVRNADVLRVQLLQAVRQRYEYELSALLPSQDRIPLAFHAYDTIAAQRGFRGRLTARKDLDKAYEQSRRGEEEGRLLVIGPPGAGKTVALLHLALTLVERAQSNPSSSIPVILNLGGWGTEYTDVSDWIVRQLTMSTGLIPGQVDLARQWVDAGVVAGLFDGLDEITDRDTRRTCLDLINTHLVALPSHTPCVLVCRATELDDINTSLHRGGRPAVNLALFLEPLDISQVQDFLDQELGIRATVVSDIVRHNPTGPLATTLRLPLWLSLTSRSPALHELATAQSEEDVSRILIEQFISSTIGGRGSAQRRWLAVIAALLNDDLSPDHTTFRLEHLSAHFVTLRTRIVVGLAIILFVTSSIGMLGVYSKESSTDLWRAVIFFGVLSAAIVLINGRTCDPQPTAFRWGWPGWGGIRLLPGVIVVSMVSVGAVYILARLVLTEATFALREHGVLVALTTAFAATFLLFRFYVVREAVTIDDARALSLRSFLIVTAWGTIAGLLLLFVFDPGLTALWVGLTVGLLVGLPIGLNQGGWYLILQRASRRRAWKRGLLPHPNELVQWLDATTKSGLLRRVGGGLQFRHRAFKDYLALESPDRELANIRGGA